jgi:hypothetical protein
MKTQLTDTHPKVKRVQISLLRKAGMERRLQLTFSLSSSAIQLSRAALRQRYPNLSERELRLKFVALCYGEELAGRVRRYLEHRNLEQ